MSDPRSGPAARIPPDLPIADLVPRLLRVLASPREGPSGAVVVAPPGAGKTTAIPLALLDAPWLQGRKILLLEPRRLAARAAAWRMADLLGETDVGMTVGYRVRMDTRVGPRTRIEVVTEGILTRMLQEDPGAEGVGAILFDEFHERSLHADLGLALALEARDLFHPDLRLLVMSATLDPEPVARLLRAPGGPPASVFRSEGRQYPVETVWRERPVRESSPRGWIEPAVAATVRRALAEVEGDVLVFLPGAAEIRRTARALEDRGAGVDLHLLHGSLSREAQDRALAPAARGRRKIVLASAVAETSLTIEGVRVVVDSGLMRIPRFDPGTAMTRLETVRVSRDTADQRRGRAGRTAPGVCYRLWTEGEDRGLVPHRTPEVVEADLAPLVMELARWGAEAGDLRWVDPPPAGGVSAALGLLRDLGVVDDAGALTAHGEQVARMGAHPRLGHLLLSAARLGVGAVGCEIAALLGERDPLRGDGQAPDADLRLRVEALRSPGGGSAPLPGLSVDRGALARARKEAGFWRRRLENEVEAMPQQRQGSSGTDVAHVGILAALAWPDRVGRLRGGNRYLLAGGRGAILEGDQTLVGRPWLVAVEVDGRGPDVRILQAAPVELEEVEDHLGHHIKETEEVTWNSGAGRVEAARIRRLGALELSRSGGVAADPGRITGVLAEGIRGMGLEALAWTAAGRALRQRLAFLHHLAPEDWPGVSDEVLLGSLEDWLLPLVPGARSLAELTRVELAEALLARLPWEQRARLDQWAPTHLEVPSGSRVALDYADPSAPVLAARLQELFGMRETPRLAGGRVRVTVHLLSPARRPVQVTQDLESFWREGYFEVRKDLRGRYPRHFWPDDPLTAPATRRVRPRGS
jgi:ATP-dependent helicase HrpB